MPTGPTLTTARLVLRPFTLADAAAIQRLAGDAAIARGTFMPHPYEDGMAEAWITAQQADFEQGRLVNFAVTLAVQQTLIGSIGMTLEQPHRRGQLGYWIGVPYWNQGYASEAGHAVVQYGFATLELHRIWAPHFKRNPASGRVLQKIGMQYEGCQREHYFHQGQFVDVMIYGMVRAEFSAQTNAETAR